MTKETDYVELDEKMKELVAAVRLASQGYIDLLKALPPGRETSIALTNAEQAAMWAIKGISRSYPRPIEDELRAALNG